MPLPSSDSAMMALTAWVGEERELGPVLLLGDVERFEFFLVKCVI